MLSCLVKQYSFMQSFLLVGTIIETWRPILKEKLLCSQKKLFFCLVKNSFFYYSDIPRCENSFSVKWKRIFLTNSSFRLVKMDFMSSGKSIFLFRALLKLLKFGGVTSCLWKLIFQLVELIFPICQILLLGKAIFFLFQGGRGERICSRYEKRIFCLVKTVFFYSVLLSWTSKPLLKLVETRILYFL